MLANSLGMQEEVILTSKRNSCRSPSSVSSSRKTLPTLSTIKTLPFSATVRFFAPTGPEVTSASTGVDMPEFFAFSAALALLTGFLPSLRFSFSIARFCFLFHCMLSSFSCGCCTGVEVPPVGPPRPGIDPMPPSSPQAMRLACRMYRSTNSRCLFQLRYKAP